MKSMLISVLVAQIEFLNINVAVKIASYSKIDKRAAILLFFVQTLFYPIVFFFSKQIAPYTIFVANATLILLSPLCIFRNKQKSQCLFIASLVMGLSLITSEIIEWIINITARGLADSNIIILSVKISLLSILLLTLKKGTFTRLFRFVTHSPAHIKAILLLSVWISALQEIMLCVLPPAYQSFFWMLLIRILTVALITLICIMCPLLIRYNGTSVFYKYLSDAMDKQVQAQMLHYNTTNIINENIRIFKHDFKNLRLGLISLLHKNDLTGALALLDTDEMSQRELAQSFDTGNAILDALLCEKQVSATKVNALIRFEGSFSSNLLDSAAICIIFGNALDNAIEACTKCADDRKRVISITSGLLGGILLIKIKNPASVNVRIVNDTVETTKEDKSSHGLGLISMQSVIEKRSGCMSLSCDNGFFTVEIAIDFNR